MMVSFIEIGNSGRTWCFGTSEVKSLRYHIDIPLRLLAGNAKLANEHSIPELSEGVSAHAVRFVRFLIAGRTKIKLR